MRPLLLVLDRHEGLSRENTTHGGFLESPMFDLQSQSCLTSSRNGADVVTGLLVKFNTNEAPFNDKGSELPMLMESKTSTHSIRPYQQSTHLLVTKIDLLFLVLRILDTGG